MQTVDKKGDGNNGEGVEIKITKYGEKLKTGQIGKRLKQAKEFKSSKTGKTMQKVGEIKVPRCGEKWDKMKKWWKAHKSGEKW